MPIDTSFVDTCGEDVHFEAVAKLRTIDGIRQIPSGEPGSVEALVGNLQDVLKGFGFRGLDGAPFEDVLNMVDEAAFAPLRAKSKSGELRSEGVPDAVDLMRVVLRALEYLQAVEEIASGVKVDVERLLEVRFKRELAEFVGKVRDALPPQNSVANREEVIVLVLRAARQLGVQFQFGREGCVPMSYMGDVPSDKIIVAKYIEGPHGVYAVVCNEANEAASATTQSVSILFASNMPGPTGEKCWSFLSREEA